MSTKERLPYVAPPMPIPPPPPRDPYNDREWQSAADAAHALLAIDAARNYGLVIGGPVINVERCQEILSLAKRKNIGPQPDAIERLVAQLIGDH